MRTFLFLLILLCAGDLGYELYQHNRDVSDYREERTRLQPDVAQLRLKNHTLLAEHTALTQKVTALQTQVADLKGQINAMQQAVAPVTTPPAAMPGTTPTPSGAAPAELPPPGP